MMGWASPIFCCWDSTTQADGQQNLSPPLQVPAPLSLLPALDDLSIMRRDIQEGPGRAAAAPGGAHPEDIIMVPLCTSLMPHVKPSVTGLTSPRQSSITSASSSREPSMHGGGRIASARAPAARGTMSPSQSGSLQQTDLQRYMHLVQLCTGGKPLDQALADIRATRERFSRGCGFPSSHSSDNTTSANRSNSNGQVLPASASIPHFSSCRGIRGARGLQHDDVREARSASALEC